MSAQGDFAAYCTELLAPAGQVRSRRMFGGGKVIVYHGWADPLAAPQVSINAYERLVAAEGRGSAGARRVQDFYRLFMVPGMYHCGYGPGPNVIDQPYTGQVVAQPPLQADAQHDIFRALQAWVENGTAPASVVCELNAWPGTRLPGHPFLWMR